MINALKDTHSVLESAINPHDVLSPNLADYIFVPLSYLLKLPNLNDVTITYVLKIITILIKHSWSSNLPYPLARQLFPLITFLTGGSPNPKDDTEINRKSDELKSAGSITLYEFFQGLAIQKKNKEYDFFSNVENLPALGHSVTALLKFAEKSTSIELQLQSLSTLSTLYFELINDGEILSYVLPGNVSTLTKILNSKGTKTHYTIVIEAINLLERLLVLVYNDEDLKIDYKAIESIDEALQEEFDHIQLRGANFTKVHRTRSWLKGTSGQVKKALGNLIVLQNHSKLEVKKSLLKFCNSVIEMCLYSLGTSIPIIIKLMANLSNTIPVNLNFVKTCKNTEYLQSILSEELNGFVDSFASTIQSPNYEKTSMNINSIQFLFEFCSNDFLVSKLINTTILEINDMLVKKLIKPNLINESDSITDLMMTIKDMSNLSLNPKALSIYDKVLNKDIQLQLARMFQTLGEKIDPSQIINEILIDDVDKTLNERGISLWIANNLMQGYTARIQPDVLFDEFLDFEESGSAAFNQKPDLFIILDYCKSLVDEISESTITPQVEQVSSVAIDTIGVVANLMKSEFESELVDYLYPVIDSLASSSEIIRNHALNTAMIIADNLYQGSLNQLIIRNTDYLIDAISERLSNAMTTRSTGILAVCTKLVGYRIVESFKDVIEITFNLLDYYHGYEDLCMDFFVLFQVIIEEIRKKYLTGSDVKKLEQFDGLTTFKPWGMKDMDQVIALLDKSKQELNIDFDNLELQESLEEEDKIKEIDSDDEDDSDIDSQQRNDHEENGEAQRQFAEDISKWVSPIPQETYKLLQQIASYGERLLTHPSTRLQLQILKTMNKIVPLFATQPNNLLPIIANIWPVISTLVLNEDPKIVISATDVMITIINHCDTFVTQRIIEFWNKSLKNHHLFKTTSKIASTSNKINLPGLNMKCFQKLVNLLTVVLNNLGKFIADLTVYEMIEICVPIVDDVEVFGEFADIAWIVKFEMFSRTGDLPLKPDFVMNEGEMYDFLSGQINSSF